MANTFTQINLQAVFAVKYRNCLITEDYSEQLFKYIAGILREIKCRPLSVCGYLNHIHILYELHPAQSVSEQMSIVKSNSSKWINDKGFVRSKFEWQNGYGAFGVGKNDRSRVMNYIMNQKEHHQEINFKAEYLKILNDEAVDFDERYLFDFLE
jgi:putative transposase